jgi:hypothetical protein
MKCLFTLFTGSGLHDPDRNTAAQAVVGGTAKNEKGAENRAFDYA